MPKIVRPEVVGHLGLTGPNIFGGIQDREPGRIEAPRVGPAWGGHPTRALLRLNAREAQQFQGAARPLEGEAQAKVGVDDRRDDGRY